MVFADRSVTAKLSSEITCAIGFGHTRLPSDCKRFPANYSLVLHVLSTLNDLLYMIYGLWMPQLSLAYYNWLCASYRCMYFVWCSFLYMQVLTYVCNFNFLPNTLAMIIDQDDM